MLDQTRGVKNDAAVWSRSRRLAGALTAAFLGDGIDVVVAEGEFLEEGARREFASMLPDGVRVQMVTLRASLSTALERVDRDPTRGVSRDRGFLARHYADMENVLARRPSDDLVLDTDEMTLEKSVQAVLDRALDGG
jgi:hypothetical protein